MAVSGMATLYDPAFEHDSCGFGLVAQVDGHASAALVDTAFAALAKLSHRDGVSGVLIHRPVDWLRALATADERFAAGLVFLDPAGGEAARAGGASALPFQTGHPKIFAGGDNMRGADLVVRAEHDGREAAVSIAWMLGELPLEVMACVA
ncbi:hypothetical protein RHOFW510R12_14995 [Rhodanobacter sp. FW510-R12]|nr:MAG: hypothetical protein EPN35_02610 [Rhodanobacter sp.]